MRFSLIVLVALFCGCSAPRVLSRVAVRVESPGNRPDLEISAEFSTPETPRNTALTASAEKIRRLP